MDADLPALATHIVTAFSVTVLIWATWRVAVYLWEES